ncbi:hypothetical protein D9758_017968 [Tetrapyrgos nigripes]|uniref:Uncharacterized protein n=1 Tax=Tetrapyrgos nigripes TaxID=182062 RepID=A0A8H5FGG4_9AGAR|nr:hypothetical protein D9758_017968 [Tetrapyrgos nigripes]
MPSLLGVHRWNSDVVPRPSSPPAPLEVVINQPSPPHSLLLTRRSTSSSAPPPSPNITSPPFHPTQPSLPSVNSSHFASRRPRPENQIQPSSLRPHVLAKHRLQDWESPWSLEHRAKAKATYGDEVVQLAEAMAGVSVVESSFETYAAGPLRFTQFCDEYKVDEHLRMPADKVLVAAFIGFHLGQKSGSSLNNWLSGLKMWHDMKGAPWCGGERWVQMACRAGNREGAHLKRPLRSPVTYHHLQILRKYLYFSKPFHRAVWAVAVVCFLACRRLGELTIPSKSKFNSRFHASHATTFKQWLESDVPCLSFHLPWTKSTRELGAEVILTARLADPHGICGVQAIGLHYQLNGNIPDEYSMFGYFNDQGLPQHMVKTDFLTCCFDIWKREAMCDVLGHSFRIGGAVFHLLDGLAPEMVAKLGGWTSLAFLLYWRRINEIISKATVDVYKKQELEKVYASLEEFRERNGISRSTIQEALDGLANSSLHDTPL